MELRSTHLFRMEAKLSPIRHEIGDIPQGHRVIVSLTDGWFEGPRMRGTVLPGGSDWALMRPDGVMDVDVRLTLKTDDAALIYMRYTGIIRHARAAFRQRARGITPDPAEMYFRTVPTFETSSERYAWLNTIIAIATGELPPDGVNYDVFEID